MELQDLSDESLQRINQKLTRLVELKNDNGETVNEINLDDSDLQGAEEQAMQYLKRRKAGYRNLENPEDADIRNGVREWVKRTNRYRNL
jgi:hypothetical protein